MRARIVVLIGLLAAIAAAAVLYAPRAYDRLAGAPAKAAPATGRALSRSAKMGVEEAAPQRTVKTGTVNVKTQGYWSWALLDRHTNTISGSPNLSATNTTESMIKVWIVSDFLRRLAEQKKQPTNTQLKQATTAILDSNDNSAQALWVAGGGKAMIPRLISTCGLTDTKGDPNSRWSLTYMSAQDAVRMGLCIADGRAAGPQWTNFVLTQMRNVRGTVQQQQLKSGGGRWGIIEGLPAEVQPTVAIKNGWTAHAGSWIGDNNWHLNCLAIGEDFVLAVEARYPISLGLAYGAGLCKSVTQQLVAHAQAR
jgi:hypothetical protein